MRWVWKSTSPVREMRRCCGLISTPAAPTMWPADEGELDFVAGAGELFRVVELVRKHPRAIPVISRA